MALEIDPRPHLSQVLGYEGGDLVQIIDVPLVTTRHVYDVPAPLIDPRRAGFFQPNPHDERLGAKFQNIGRLLQNEIEGTTDWSARTSFYRLDS